MFGLTTGERGAYGFAEAYRPSLRLLLPALDAPLRLNGDDGLAPEVRDGALGATSGTDQLDRRLTCGVACDTSRAAIHDFAVGAFSWS